jgi:uncharacterized protein (TIGR02266 family)
LLVRCETWAEFVQLYASDISRGGMFIVTDDPPPALSAIEVRMTLPEGHEVPLKGRVVHVLPADHPGAAGRGAGVGVEFVELDELRKQQIHQLIEFARSEGASQTPHASFASHMFELTASLPPAQLVRSLPPAPETAAARDTLSGTRPTSGRPTNPGKKQRRTTRRSSPGGAGSSNEPSPPKPSDPEKVKLGLSHFARRRYDEAVQTFAGMLEDNPGDVEALRWIYVAHARACLHRDDQDGAAQAYRQALEHDESNLEARKFVREHQLKRRLNAIPFGRFFVKPK